MPNTYGLPKKPFRGFYYFAADLKSRAHKELKPGDFPCYYCIGSGKVWDPYGADDYEGNKLNRKILCQVCSGTGIVTADVLRSYYREHYLRPWQMRVRQAKLDKKMRDQIRAKLTPAERKAIGL